jgi:hypothetical protein
MPQLEISQRLALHFLEENTVEDKLVKVELVSSAEYAEEHKVVFDIDGTLYETGYILHRRLSIYPPLASNPILGLPWENNEFVTLTEVEPHTVTTTVYRAVT